jgi:hypothetical protein
LHDTQIPLQALSQHTPSAQNPLAQFVPEVQVEPLAALHLPVPSHAVWPEQLPATSMPGVTAEQVPSLPATLQALQAPAQVADSQHTPSTQLPLAQRLAKSLLHPVPLPKPVTLYSQVSSRALPPFPEPPKSTTTARLLS